MQNLHRIAVLLAGIGMLAGCSSKGPPRAAVSGTVKLDGEPVADGMIMFVPTGQTRGPSVGGRIADGRYSIPARGGVVIGQNRVEITWSKPTGKQVADPLDPGKMLQERQEVIPDRYNVTSELEREVSAGTNAGGEFDFDLQTQPK